MLSTRSTHIISAAGLDAAIICLETGDRDREVHTASPGRDYGEDSKGLRSKRSAERYLDATNSTMLFTKGVLRVDGLAEQLVMSVSSYVGWRRRAPRWASWATVTRPSMASRAPRWRPSRVSRCWGRSIVPSRVTAAARGGSRRF